MVIQKIKDGNYIDAIVLLFCRLIIAGASPFAPGTCGTFLACLAAPVLFFPLSLTLRFLVVFLVLITGALAATRAEKILNCKDPGQVVVDELFGVWIVFLPFKTYNFTLLLLAFISFRAFDIFKPWPIKASENFFPAGWGVMLDDGIAGVYALLVVLVINQYASFAEFF
jgi:phosphatidylglycerophosphatase A